MVSVVIGLIVNTLLKVSRTDKEIVLFIFAFMCFLWLILSGFAFFKLVRRSFNKKNHFEFMVYSFVFTLIPIWGLFNICINLIRGSFEGGDWSVFLVIILNVLFILNIIYSSPTERNRR